MKMKKPKDTPQPPLVVRLPEGERWSWNQKRDQSFPRNEAIIESLVQDGELRDFDGKPTASPSNAELKVAAKEAYHRLMKNATARNAFPKGMPSENQDAHLQLHFPALHRAFQRILDILEPELELENKS